MKLTHMSNGTHRISLRTQSKEIMIRDLDRDARDTLPLLHKELPSPLHAWFVHQYVVLHTRLTRKGRWTITKVN